MSNTVEWRPTVDPRLEVSSDGQIRSIKFKKIRRNWRTALGYEVITLDDPATGKRRTWRLHQVVWHAFNGPVPDGYVLDHVNREPSDNRLDNLRLVTFSENCRNRSLMTGKTGPAFIGVINHYGGRYRGRCGIAGGDRSTAVQDSMVDAAAMRDLLAIEMSGSISVPSLNFPMRFGLSTPPAHNASLRTVRQHFAVGHGYLWVSLDRAGIDVSCIVHDQLITIDHGGTQFIRCTDAIDWHDHHGTTLPGHMEVCRLLLATMPMRGAK